MSSTALLLPFLLLFFNIDAISSTSNTNKCFIRSIYSFGDSIADTGNLHRKGRSGASAVMNFLPYGETFFRKPTGRCSDGLLIIDYLAMAFDLPFINPYLDENADFKHGVNFAVAGATAMDASFFLERGVMLPVTTISLSKQLHWFHTHLNSTCSAQTVCGKHLEKALFLMGEIGGNDYNYHFFQGRSIKEVESFVPLVVDKIIDAAKQVISIGATKLLVPGNFPVGCMPSYLTHSHSLDPAAYDELNCLKDLNSFAMLHNQMLQEALDQLRQEHPNVTIMYADYYKAFIRLLTNASKLGFDTDSLLKACCGIGGDYNFDVNRMCGTPGSRACPEPARRISWDGIHLTQQAYKFMAQSLMTEDFTYHSHGVLDKWKCKNI